MSGELALSYERQIDSDQARRLGKRALWQAGFFKAELGVNDPLTHLEQYLERGEAALDSIDEDLITDIAERKLKPKFINSIVFDHQGDDFVSRENEFSMVEMTTITESKFSSSNVANLEQYERAKIEAKEVHRLNTWFKMANPGEVFICESMPLGEERYAVVRIYEKTDESELVEHVLTLHNSSVDLFNQLHQEIKASVPESENALELLDNMYASSPGQPDFVTKYIENYDRLISGQNDGREFNFGLPKMAEPEQDDIETVRRHAVLRSVYLDTIKALGKSGGWVSKEVANLNHGLGGAHELLIDTPISRATAAELLDRSLQSVVATFNRASHQQLENLAGSQDISSALASAGYYGGEARAEGVRYDGACPSAPSPAQAEAAALSQAHKFNKDPSRCGTCPECRKQYYVEESVYKARILECNNCHAAIRFGGGAVSKKDLDKLHGRVSADEIGFMDLIMLSFKKAGLESKIDRLIEKHQSPELSDFERRRGARLIDEYAEELESIKYLTS